MDWKRLGVNATVLLAFAVLLTAGTWAGAIIGSGTLPTANSTVEITKAEEATLKQAFNIQGSIDENFFIGELVCDSNQCKATIKKEGLINDSVEIPLMKCVSFDVTNICLEYAEKTAQELAGERDNAIQARLKEIAEASKQRLEATKTAKVGDGNITVNVK